MKRLWVMAAAALVAAGCAQPRAPTGGEQDRTPPRVVAVTPGHYTTVTDLRSPLVIRFDERLSERLQGVTELREAVTVSPATGAVRARRGRREIEISIEGGWRPGLVYRVVVEPVLRDLFGNQRTEAIDVVFSTGAPIQQTAVAGFVEDRITGRPVRGARVEATRRLDTLTYVARTDTGGFFALRHLPAGAYDVTAWLDQNRSGVPDFQEPQDRGMFSLGYQDTVVVEMALLPRDTVPARLVRAAALDSLTLELGFDDHFAPGPVTGTARIYRLPDSVFVAQASLVHGTELDSLRAARSAELETARAQADTARVDTAQVQRPPQQPPQAARPPGIPPGAQPPGAQPPGARPGAAPPPGRTAPGRRALPARELIAPLRVPLEPDASYAVVVVGVVNISNVPGGGGSARFQTPARPRAPEAPPPDTVPPPPPPPPDTLGRR